ncbi:hypothetical protein ACWGRK_19185 [Saccharomonospora azurea]|uniref:Uncharacterized protein n=1 Tax=Saccharomonospora azurea NA-128 TaxID=882081 RepID=H8GBL7_9PSEU|nr:hypothetical protein [Saccharomonospora azurea]EHY88701.1 hypothetical protein SacazDRAFT_01780 [Saccharomonospora azurea NA-128]
MADGAEARKLAAGGYAALPIADIRKIAADQRRRFAGKAMRIGDNDTVHAVRLRTWVHGERIPAPACHIGTDTTDVSGERTPVSDQPVNCKRCLSYKVAREEGEPYRPRLAQIGLWPDGEDHELPAWPPSENE